MRIVMRTSNSQDWRLVESAGYTAEEQLQSLLADSPSLIPVGDIQEGASPLVCAVREVSTPSGGAIDVLAFSATGDITIVECKLSANSDRRQVLAQVLDYASDLWQMPYQDLNERVKKTSGKDLAEEVQGRLGDELWDEETFRRGVTATLDTGFFSLVIAVDQVDDQLRRMIRYMNVTGKPGFHLAALEMERFESEEAEMLVPRVYSPHGDTGGKVYRWDDQRFYQTCETNLPSEVVAVIRDLHRWAKVEADSVEYGAGHTTGSLNYYYKLNDGRWVHVFQVTTAGVLYLNYGDLSLKSGEEVTRQLHEEIRRVPSFSQVPDDLTKYPGIRIGDRLAAHPEDVEAFKLAIKRLRELASG